MSKKVASEVEMRITAKNETAAAVNGAVKNIQRLDQETLRKQRVVALAMADIRKDAATKEAAWRAEQDRLWAEKQKRQAQAAGTPGTSSAGIDPVVKFGASLFAVEKINAVMKASSSAMKEWAADTITISDAIRKALDPLPIIGALDDVAEAIGAVAGRLTGAAENAKRFKEEMVRMEQIRAKYALPPDQRRDLSADAAALQSSIAQRRNEKMMQRGDVEFFTDSEGITRQRPSFVEVARFNADAEFRQQVLRDEATLKRMREQMEIQDKLNKIEKNRIANQEQLAAVRQSRQTLDLFNQMEQEQARRYLAPYMAQAERAASSISDYVGSIIGRAFGVDGRRGASTSDKAGSSDKRDTFTLQDGRLLTGVSSAQDPAAVAQQRMAQDTGSTAKNTAEMVQGIRELVRMARSSGTGTVLATIFPN